MARPLRIEFPGALYHVTSRGDRQEAIFVDDDDRHLFLRTLDEVVGRFDWLCHAYCLMTNHYHLLVETPEPNLSRGMRHLNGVFTQASNRRHDRGGHVFQGRFKSILVDRDGYLLELTRYIVLNPVRGGMVACPGDWPWSSYRATSGKVPCPRWLCADRVLAQFSPRRTLAQRRYVRFVAAAGNDAKVWSGLRQQIYLGDDEFVARAQRDSRVRGDRLTIPRAQRRPPAQTLVNIARRFPNRNDAFVAAYATGAYSYRVIAEYFGVHPSTVARAVRDRTRAWTG